MAFSGRPVRRVVERRVGGKGVRAVRFDGFDPRPGVLQGTGGREHAVGVVLVEEDGFANLLEVGDVLVGLGGGVCLCQNREHHGGEDGHDGDDDEEFNEGKGFDSHG